MDEGETTEGQQPRWKRPGLWPLVPGVDAMGGVKGGFTECGHAAANTMLHPISYICTASAFHGPLSPVG